MPEFDVTQHAAHLWLFFVLLLGVIVLPGLDMAFIMASSLVDGRRAGLVAVAGVVAGGVCHTLMGALGVGVVLRLFPAAFNVLLLAGAAYIAWLGAALARSRLVFDAGSVRTVHRPPASTFGRAMATCLLNPKAYVFMLAVFPQFLRPEWGPVPAQALVLGSMIALTQAGVYGAVAWGAAAARDGLARRPGVSVWLGRGVGAVLLLASGWTVWSGWR